MTQTKLFKLIRRIGSVIAFALALYYLIYLFKSKVVQFDIHDIGISIMGHFSSFLLVIFLMPVNWGIEVIKWRRLIMSFQEISFWKSIKSVLAGILAGSFTPSRIGEIGGRLMYLEKENRSRGLYVNSLCSISQNLATLLYGLTACFILSDTLANYLSLDKRLIEGTILLTIPVSLFVYLKGNILGRAINSISQKWLPIENENVIVLSSSERLYLFLVSSFRYFVFCIQFVLVIRIFNSTSDLVVVFSGVSIVFLFTTLIPSGWVSDIAVRTSISFFIFNAMGLEGESALIASLLLWTINLFIPTLLSLPILSELNWSTKTEE